MTFESPITSGTKKETAKNVGSGSLLPICHSGKRYLHVCIFDHQSSHHVSILFTEPFYCTTQRAMTCHSVQDCKQILSTHYCQKQNKSIL